MTFYSNVQPRKKKKAPAQTWICKCPRTNPAYILRCQRCGRGQS